LIISYQLSAISYQQSAAAISTTLSFPRSQAENLLLANRSTARDPSARVPSVTGGNSMSCREFRPSASVSRLTQETRRSQRSLSQQVFGPSL
jgi:hypothetical protein